MNDEDFDNTEWEETILQDATALNGGQRLRVLGRLPPGAGILFGEDGDLSLEDNTPVRQSRDIWDCVVAEAIEKYEDRRKLLRQGGRERHMSKLVAQKLQAEWDAQEAKRLRAISLDQRKAKVLAKVTARLVQDEWKKIVHVSILPHPTTFHSYRSTAYSRGGATEGGGSRDPTRSSSSG